MNNKIILAPKFEPLEFPPGAVVDGRVSWRYVTGPVCRDEKVWADLDEALDELLDEYACDVQQFPGTPCDFPLLWACDKEFVGIGEWDFDRMIESALDEHHEDARLDYVDELRAYIAAWNKRQTSWTADEGPSIDFAGYPWSRWFLSEPDHPALAELRKEFGPEEVSA